MDKKKLILPHPKILNQNKPGFNGGFSRDNMANKIKDGNYLINLDEYADSGTHPITLFCAKIKLITLTVLELNMFLKKLKNLLSTKT